MKTVLILLAMAAPAMAQCCLGAQNGKAVSKNGRYKVEATSMTGTGPRFHGPYQFKYTWSELDDTGKFQETHSFEVKYESTNHFRMGVLVSPTGNGFWVETSIAERSLVFYSKTGKKLRGYDLQSPVLSEDGLYLVDGETKLFVPFGAPVGEVLDRQLKELLQWSPDQGDKEAIAKAVKDLDEDDAAVREKASQTILTAGLSAAALEKLIGEAPSVESKDRATRLLEEIRYGKAAGHDVWRDLTLLGALLFYPNAEVAALARGRLEKLLPAEGRPAFDPAAWREWIESNRGKLRWDEKTQSYK
jgi:hypothetical protein